MAAEQSKVAQLPQKSEYSEIELLHPIVNCTLIDRKSQRVSLLRVMPQEKYYFREHAAGIEVCGGGAWCGVVPWSNIKMAKR